MDAKTNGAMPATPCQPIDSYGNPCSEMALGLTKRELFAAMAMQGLCARKSPPSQGWAETLDEAFAREAVDRADALLAALSQEPQ